MYQIRSPMKKRKENRQPDAERKPTQSTEMQAGEAQERVFDHGSADVQTLILAHVVSSLVDMIEAEVVVSRYLITEDIV